MSKAIRAKTEALPDVARSGEVGGGGEIAESGMYRSLREFARASGRQIQEFILSGLGRSDVSHAVGHTDTMQPMKFPLLAAEIVRHSEAAASGLEVEVVESTGSTNADLRAKIADLSVARLYAAENQTAGRGRAGRSWQAAPGSSLCFSLAWKFQGEMSVLAGLPLVVGVSLAQTLAQQGWPVQLKWPNDLLKDGLKLGGVLIESVPVRIQNRHAGHFPDHQTHAVWAIIGVGINTERSDALLASVEHEITALSSTAIDRNYLLAKLLDGLVQTLSEFEQHGLKNFIDRWQHYHAYANQMVRIIEQGRILHEGLASGIDAEGRLLLQSALHPHDYTAITVGDVSLRPVTPEMNHAATH